MKLVSVIPTILFLTVSFLGQNASTRLLNPAKPSAFITFERFDKRLDVRNGESADGIYFRFHNNISTSVYLATNGSAGTGLRVSYESRLIPGLEWKQSESAIPLGTRLVHRRTIREVKPGQDLLFSIPREHLKEDFAIYVSFSYAWELLGTSGGDQSINHQAPFWASWLPLQKK